MIIAQIIILRFYIKINKAYRRLSHSILEKESDEEGEEGDEDNEDGREPGLAVEQCYPFGRSLLFSTTTRRRLGNKLLEVFDLLAELLVASLEGGDSGIAGIEGGRDASGL